MKKYIILIILGILYITSTSCEKMFGDFLSKAPGVDVTEDTIFSSQVQVEKFLYACYENGVEELFPNYSVWSGGTTTSNHLNGNAITDGASCDEGEHEINWFGGNLWNTAAMDASQFFEDKRYYARFSNIRMHNTMLERIDEVPDMDQTLKDQMKGEVKFLRAMAYFGIVKRYGGVPILDSRYIPGENWNRPRSSVDSVFKFIVKNCDEAIAVLPDSYTQDQRGRATKGAALALKSRALLFAASPLFNSATPYLEMANPADNRLLCYGAYDLNRWKEAADAAKAVIDWAPAGGVALITDKGFDKNYRYVWEVLDNSEIIMAEKTTNNTAKTTSATPWIGLVPGVLGGWSGLCPTQNFVEKFYYNRYTGKKMVWYPNGNDLLQKYDSLDYRFKQTIATVNTFWNTAAPFYNIYLAGNGFAQGNHYSGTAWTCMSMHKWVPYSTNTGYATNFILYRLAEAYLNYAEALNEFSGPGPETYAAVNILRARSGMPDLPAGLTQAEFRQRVREERAVELAWEGHRFFDIMRWKIAEEDGVMQGPMRGLKVYKLTATPTFSYTQYVFENRLWLRRMYLRPFDVVDVNKSLGVFVQNPGY